MAYFNSYCGSKRGLAVLIRNDTPITDIEWENVIPGNFSKLSFKANKDIFLINAYTHLIKTVTQMTIKTKVMDDTGEEEYNHRIITGDYNVALNHNLDTSGYLHVNNPNTREYLLRQANLSNLIDIWRIRNPNSREYTFHKKQARNFTRARLNFFLVSEN